MLHCFIAGIDGINRAVKFLLAAMMAVMSAVVIAQVFCRLTHIRMPWAEELARYLMIYVTFIGTGYAVRFDLMMSVSFVKDKLTPNQRRAVSIVSNLVILVFFLLILYFGWNMLGRVHMQRSPALQWPMSVPYAATVAGALLMAVNAITVILERLSKKP